jgi:hypothetical protein
LFLKNPLRSRPSRGFADAFVIKLSPDGARVVFGTLLGGSRLDGASGIAVDAAHNVYVVGYTDSDDFPTTGGHEDSCSSELDAFAVKISPNGDRLVYSRCLGGGSSDVAAAVAVDPYGNTYLAGTTRSDDFPTRRALQPRNSGGVLSEDGFIAKLDQRGELVYSTYLGGWHGDFIYDIALTEDQEVVAVGGTDSSDFPTQAALQPTIGGGRRDYIEDAFVTRIASSGDRIDFSTYLGGADRDHARGVAIDRDGRIVIVGFTTSADFPTRHALQGSLRGSCDAFVARLRSDGAQLDRATYLGGSGAGTEVALDVAVLWDGRVIVLGVTNTEDFPIKGATQATTNGAADLFITSYFESMTGLAFSTYLGGSGDEPALAGGSSFRPLTFSAIRPGLAADATGALVLTADTTSSDFPLKAALGSRFPGELGAVVVKLAHGEPPPAPSEPAACRFLVGRAPAAVVSSSLADPTRVMGWGQLCNPNLPRSRLNIPRTWLTLLNIARPYHPLHNPVVFRCGCP